MHTHVLHTCNHTGERPQGCQAREHAFRQLLKLVAPKVQVAAKEKTRRKSSVRVDRGKDCLHALLFTLQLLWHYYLTPHHTSSIIPLDSCLRRRYPRYNTALTPKVLPPITENMLCRWYIFHHTTHTSPYFRQIGKHIWRQRLDAHAGQAQTARFCRARAVSREQTRRVDTENAIAKKSGSLISTQVPRPVFARSQPGNQPVRDFESEGPSYPP